MTFTVSGSSGLTFPDSTLQSTAAVAAGSPNQVQYNSGGAFAGSSNLTFNGTTLTANTLNLTNVLGESYGGTGTSIGYNNNKNRIINGAMMIDQRNAGASVGIGSTTVAGNYVSFDCNIWNRWFWLLDTSRTFLHDSTHQVHLPAYNWTAIFV